MNEDKEFNKELEQAFNARNAQEFRASGGIVGGSFEGFPLLLLTTIGAKSGQERLIPLAISTSKTGTTSSDRRQAGTRTRDGSPTFGRTRLCALR